jgi:5'-nucleotidase
LLAIVAVWTVLSGVSSGAETDKKPILVIYHTNDVHGYVFHETDDDGHAVRWGYNYVKAVVDRDGSYNKMLLDAGDALSGQPLATASHSDLVARMLMMMHYDAITAGDHDFDYGWERLLSLRDIYRLNFISANVTERESGRHVMLSYAVRNFPNLKVGIIGLSTPSTPTLIDPRNVAALSFHDPKATISVTRDIIKRLREVEGVQLVIALTHLGSETDCDPSSLTLAREAQGIDLIIDGHSHSVIDGGIKVGNTVIASTGAFLANLGRIEVFSSPDGGYEFNAALLPASASEHITPNPELSAVLMMLKSELNKVL